MDIVDKIIAAQLNGSSDMDSIYAEIVETINDAGDGHFAIESLAHLERRSIKLAVLSWLSNQRDAIQKARGEASALKGN